MRKSYINGGHWISLARPCLISAIIIFSGYSQLLSVGWVLQRFGQQILIEKPFPSTEKDSKWHWRGLTSEREVRASEGGFEF